MQSTKKYAGKGLGTQIIRNILNNIINISESDIGLRFVVVEGYASAYDFYVTQNNFINLKKDDKIIKKIDEIKKRDPTRTFYLYIDLKNLELD